MPKKSPFIVKLSTEEKRELEARVRKYTLPYSKILRARMILLAAKGLTNKEIGQRLGTRREIVSLWRKRFFQSRLAGLEERPRSGRPRRARSLKSETGSH